MKWTLKTPASGDMVRVKAGSIYHYGVFVSESEIIQFGLAPVARQGLKDTDIEVCCSDVDTFLCGGFLEVAEFDRAERRKNRRPAKAIEYARSKLGTRGYNILYNNCEHFAYDCVTGKPYCSQTADVRALFRSLPVADVYVARIPASPELTKLYPPERQAELDEVTNERVRTEKWCVWKLLEYALERSFGFKMKDMAFSKNEHGKWTTEKCFFSLSHCDGAVAVAVSRAEVGVDIETDRPALRDRMAQKILNESELELYKGTPAPDRTRFLLEKWSAKESLFKAYGSGSAFVPIDFDTLSGKVNARILTLNEREYALSVATETPDVVRTYEVDLLSKI